MILLSHSPTFQLLDLLESTIPYSSEFDFRKFNLISQFFSSVALLLSINKSAASVLA